MADVRAKVHGDREPFARAHGVAEASFGLDRDPGDLHLAAPLFRYERRVVAQHPMPHRANDVVRRPDRVHREVPDPHRAARSEVPHRIRGLEVGADDYLAKPFNPRELVGQDHCVGVGGRHSRHLGTAGGQPRAGDKDPAGTALELDKRMKSIVMPTENFGAPLESVFAAVRRLVDESPALTVIYPVHPNPAVRGPASRTSTTSASGARSTRA